MHRIASIAIAFVLTMIATRAIADPKFPQGEYRFRKAVVRVLQRDTGINFNYRTIQIPSSDPYHGGAGRESLTHSFLVRYEKTTFQGYGTVNTNTSTSTGKVRISVPTKFISYVKTN